MANSSASIRTEGSRLPGSKTPQAAIRLDGLAQLVVEGFPAPIVQCDHAVTSLCVLSPRLRSEARSGFGTVDRMNCIMQLHTVSPRIRYPRPLVNRFPVTKSLHVFAPDTVPFFPLPNLPGTLFRIFTAFSTIQPIFLPYREFSEPFPWFALTFFVTSCILFVIVMETQWHFSPAPPGRRSVRRERNDPHYASYQTYPSPIAHPFPLRQLPARPLRWQWRNRLPLRPRPARRW